MQFGVFALYVVGKDMDFLIKTKGIQSKYEK